MAVEGRADAAGAARRVRLVGVTAIPNRPARPPVRFFLIDEGKRTARALCRRTAGRSAPTAIRPKPCARSKATARQRGVGQRQHQESEREGRRPRNYRTRTPRRTGKPLTQPAFRLPRFAQEKRRKLGLFMAQRPHRHGKGFLCNGCKEWHPKDIMHCELV